MVIDRWIGVPQGWVGVMGCVRRGETPFFCRSVASFVWDSALVGRGCWFDTSVSAFGVGVGPGISDVESLSLSHVHAHG